MRFVALALTALSGCVHYETFLDAYGGMNSAESGTVGARVGQILFSEDSFGAGLAADVSAVLRDDVRGEDEVSQVVLAPLVVAVYRLEYVEPYLAIGPALFVTGGDDDRSTDFGADLRVGLKYQLGTWFGSQLWVFAEIRETYVKPDLSRDVQVQSAGNSVQSASCCRTRPGPVSVTTIRSPLEVDEWTTHVFFGLSLRF